MKKIIIFSLGAILLVYALISFHKKTILVQSESEANTFAIHTDGPSEFIKFHRAIRTKEGEQKPGYENNYQLKELEKGIQHSLSINKIARTEGANGVIEFKERGPGNVPGRTRGLIVDPDDPSSKTWYAGSASGGIWKTIDGGNSWQWLTPNLPNLATTVLAMAESNHNVIYAGTGEGFGNLDAVSGSGIFKSTDRGITWNLLSSSANLDDINRIVIDPSAENTIVAATNTGIYRSTNGGNSWVKVFTGYVQDLRPTPGNFSIQYAGQNRVGVLKSIDGGATWNLSKTGMNPSGRVEIAVSAIKTDRIFASTEGTLSGNKSDLYLSDNGGTSWNLVDLTIDSKTVNYLSDQGWYDNTLACHPYNKDIVYVGGVGVYQVTIGTGSPNVVGSYSVKENNTTFLTLVNFNATSNGGSLEIGGSANKTNVEIRFGPGKSQMAHQFWVPDNATFGVLTTNYTYKGYVSVPFEVWDVTNNKQLMVSFRDQDRNGQFNLFLLNNTSAVATEQSREYIYINNVDYNPASPSSSIMATGGIAFNQMYFFWPVLSSGSSWNSLTLPTSNLQISYSEIPKLTSTVVTVSDPYNDFDGKNNRNFVHPDQHNIVATNKNDANKTFQMLLANDGGLFLSKTSTQPGIAQGDWTKVGNGYNTSQFYGVDKKPGAQEYLGGMQDNSTYFTPSGTVSSAGTQFKTNASLLGDGFEAIWNNLDGKKMIGGSQNNNFSRSLDGGSTWQGAITGLTTDKTKLPFISKLANSKQAPDILFTIGSEGVWKSNDFGGTWTLTPITTNWGFNSYTDVEVSRANANIIWAGSGMSSSLKLFVSTNGGKTFNTTNNFSNPKGSITKLASHPLEEKTAYALFSFAKSPKVLVTKDLGQSWQELSGFGNGTVSTNGFPDVAVYCLYVRPDNPNIIWAGTDIGIVESLNGGTSWALLNDPNFPNVAVWDMKGQDDEVVIATHGRGIWTAKIPVGQNSTIKNPIIIATGTSPQSDFVIRFQIDENFDSTLVAFNSKTIGKIGKITPGTYDIKIKGVSIGSNDYKLISYLGSAPIHSATTFGLKIPLNPNFKTQYFNLFTLDTDFYLIGSEFGAKEFGSSNLSLQTNHNYAPNSESAAVLKQPIIVATSNTTFFYQDVALVQPSGSGVIFGQPNFKDYVIVEATKNGLDWIPLKDGYNASANTNWLTAYTSSKPGDPTLSADQSIDLKTKFLAGDTLLFRFRLKSDADATTGWGWSIDNLFIQQTPTGIQQENTFINDLVLYPNPTSDKATLQFTLKESSVVAIETIDGTGKQVLGKLLGHQTPGSHQTEIDFENLSNGIYFIKLKTDRGERTIKMILRK